MANSDPLVPFGIAIVLIVGAFIAVPFLRRKSDLITGWNSLLLGLVLFTGLGSIEVKYVSNFAWQSLDWFQPMAKEVQWYMLATAAFIAMLLAAYYFNGPAKRFAQRRLQKWPEMNASVTFFVLGCCLTIILISFVAGRITFIGPASAKLGHKAAVFACVFSFMLWYRNRVNMAWLILFVSVLMIAMLYSMLVSPGRRLLLSIFLGPVLCAYWIHVRHWKPAKILFTMGVAACVLLAVSAAYSKFRWYSLTSVEKRSVKGVIQQIRDLQTKGDVFSVFLRGRLAYFGQSSGQFGLLTQRYVGQGTLEPVPLNSLRFLASYPIPRKVWPDKPEVIGLTVVRDVAHIPGTNWGLGIAGQGAYEGGIPALMLYAVLLAFFVRIIDEPLRMQPDNPFLIAMHAAALPHIIGIARGDMGIMFAEAAECVLFAVLLGVVTRAIFGSQRRQSPTVISSTPRQNSYPPVYPTTRMPDGRRQ
jgi:hypothetical protein